MLILRHASPAGGLNNSVRKALPAGAMIFKKEGLKIAEKN